MFIPYPNTKVGFDAAAVAAGLAIDTDIATQTVGQSVEVLALSMKGLKYLRWTLHLDVPFPDLMILLTNIQASATGKGTAWVQT